MRIYRALLKRLAPKLDREHGLGVEEMFEARRNDARRRGGVGLARFWVRELAGLLKVAASERSGERRRHRHLKSHDDRSRGPMLETLITDTQFAGRLMLRSPGFTAVVLLTLAVGIGANTVMFSVVNTVLLRPLPYAEPDKLMLVRPVEGVNRTPGFAAAPDFYRYRAQSHSFDNFDAFYGRAVNVTGGSEAERLPVIIVSSGFFSNLGIQPALGRGFTKEDEQWGSHRVAVISDGLWKRRFGQSGSTIGQTMPLNGEPHTIVGILPSTFSFLNADTQLLVPMSFAPGDNMNSHSNYFLRMIGRLKPHTSVSMAAADLKGISDAITKEESVNRGTAISVAPLQDSLVGNVRTAVLVLLGAVGFVLLICCANLANLLLARAVTRQKEVAVRIAIGASRRRLLGQFLIESLLLSLIGGFLALGVAYASTTAVNLISRQVLPRAEDVRVDPMVLVFTLGIATVTGILMGLVPAFQGTRPALAEDLKQGSRGSSDGRGSRRLRSTMVIAEVALSLVLLAGAGLMLKSMRQMLTLDAGFVSDRVLTMQLNLPPQKYIDRELTRQFSPLAMAKAQMFFDELTTRTRALPGAEWVGAINGIPVIGEVWGKNVTLLDRPLPADLSGLSPIQYRTVVGDYFRAMGIRMVNGRAFTDRDNTTEAPKVAIINRAMVKRDYPNADPIGKLITVNPPRELLPKKMVEDAIRNGNLPPNYSPPKFEIVGVADDARYGGITTPAVPVVYVPYAQGAEGGTSMYLVVRGAGDPLSVVAPIRQIVAELDRDQPVAGIETMDARVATSVARPRLQTTVFAVFAIVAILLAAVGIYGVMSYSVSQRAKEIGIRLALGSSRRDVFSLVFRNGFALVTIGVGIGLAAALALARVIRTLLFQVSTTDPLVFASIALVLFVTAGVAAWVPARRAARLDPIATLRAE
ncbi:MAG: ABC transporter permease [Vicinamibacterales bacterium]